MTISVKKLLFIISLFIFAISFATQAQKTKVTGGIFDAATKESLPFVNILFTNSYIGSASDLDGSFSIETDDQSLESITIRYLGYKEKIIDIKVGQSQDLRIELESSNQNLQEVVITEDRKSKKDTAALRIFRTVVKNKKYNRPKAVDSYEFEEYAKTQFDLYNLNDDFEKKGGILKAFDHYINSTDTTANGTKYLPFLIKESLVDHYYTKNPKNSKQIIKGENVIAFFEKSITDLVQFAFEPVNVYDNQIVINGKPFISPFSNTARLNYNYFLADSTEVGGVKSYKLEFTGRRIQDLAFSGFAWIDSRSYAIRDIELYVLPNVNINFVSELGLKVAFEFVNDSIWFKKSETVFTNLNITRNKKDQSFLIKKVINRKNIKLNQPIDPSVFSGKDDVVATKEIYKRGDKYWEENRHIAFSDKENEIVEVIDSTQKTSSYKRFKWLTNTATSAHARLGPIEFGRLYQFYSWNAIEGKRYKFGFRTNPYLSEKFRVIAYTAYGDLDKQWKYGTFFRMHLKRVNNRWHQLGGYHKKDMAQLDQNDLILTHDNLLLSILRSTPLSKLLLLEASNVFYEREWRKGITTTFAVNHQRFSSTDSLSFKRDVIVEGQTVEKTIPSITDFNIKASVQFGKDQKFYEGRYERSPLTFFNPVFYVDYTLGLKDVLGSDQYYHKIELTMRHRYDHFLGSTRYHITAGKVFGDVPFTLLKMHLGNTTFIPNYWTFEMMSDFEYVSDEYVTLWTKHRFNGIILNQIPLIRKLKWRSIVFAKGMIGRLSETNSKLVKLPQGLTGLNGSYLEAGVGLENVFKIIHLTAHWRVFPKDNPARDDIRNFAVKISFSISL